MQVLPLGLPDEYCKNTGYLATVTNLSYIRKRIFNGTGFSINNKNTLFWQCIHFIVYSSGSQTFFKKLRNGPLAIFLMAHGPLKKSTQINRKQHVVFFIMSMWRVHLLLCYQFGYVWFSVARKISCLKILFYTKFFFQERRVDFFGRCFAVPRKLSRGPQKDWFPGPCLS